MNKLVVELLKLEKCLSHSTVKKNPPLLAFPLKGIVQKMGWNLPSPLPLMLALLVYANMFCVDFIQKRV